VRPPFDLAAVDAATVQVVADGHRILQTHRYGADDRAHVKVLLDLMDPKDGAMVLDAGCGIGEVSRIMGKMRPDLSFILMNISLYQLSQCPIGEQYMHALDDCHQTLLNDSVVDAVMFSSALCQMDIQVALAEAHRVLSPGGILLVNDMVRTSGDPMIMEQAIAARVLPQSELVRLIVDAGFSAEVVTPHDYDDSNFRNLLGKALRAGLIDGVYPAVIRAVKIGSAL
jgi:SAM-dependent methyltransferase